MRYQKPDPTHPYDRVTLKSILKLLPGGKPVGNRNPRQLTATKELVSPHEVNGAYAVFTIKKADNRADVERANLFAKIDYIQPDESGEVITRREIPMGDLQIRTILLCLVKWDITDEDRPVAIGYQTLLDYLLPEERVFLYNEVLDFNPIWSNRAEAKSKPDDTA